MFRIGALGSVHHRQQERRLLIQRFDGLVFRQHHVIGNGAIAVAIGCLCRSHTKLGQHPIAISQISHGRAECCHDIVRVYGKLIGIGRRRRLLCFPGLVTLGRANSQNDRCHRCNDKFAIARPKQLGLVFFQLFINFIKYISHGIFFYSDQSGICRRGLQQMHD